MSRARTALWVCLLVVPGAACWEQVSQPWFAQMKEQPAVQASEGRAPFVPPEGTIPVGGIAPRLAASPAPFMEASAIGLQNPTPANEASLGRGKQVYETYCSVCHGTDGNLAGATVGPRVAAIPLAAIGRLSDGQLFTKIRYGKPLMPGYPQVSPEDRWHVVNYLRRLMGGGA